MDSQGQPSYADKFIKERILPKMKKTAIVNLDDTGPNYVSLTPLTQEPKPKGTGRKHKKPQLLPQFRGQSAKQLKRLMRKQQSADAREKMTCPLDLPARLHDLWTGYANGLIDWDRFIANKETNISSRMDSILRMDLIGARLRVMRSITTRQVDLEGIVVMETRNIFYLAREEEEEEGSVAARLHIVPKRGTVFLLLMTRAEVILNGTSLMHRPIDRALRKWRLNPTAGARQKRQPIYTDLMRDYLFDEVHVQSEGPSEPSV